MIIPASETNIIFSIFVPKSLWEPICGFSLNIENLFLFLQRKTVKTNALIKTVIVTGLKYDEVFFEMVQLQINHKIQRDTFATMGARIFDDEQTVACSKFETAFLLNFIFDFLTIK